MLTLLVTILIALLIVGCIVYAIDLLGLDARISMILKLLVAVIAIVLVAQRAGVLG